MKIFQKQLFIFLFITYICDVRINVNIHPYTTLMLARHLGQIELQSFIILYGVNTGKNESRILRG